MSDDWKAESFDAIVEFRGKNVMMPIAGWVKGIWALDFRVFDLSEGWDEDLSSGWMMTHKPTGRCVFGIVCPLSEAMDIADKISAMGEWEFEGDTPPKSLSGIRAKVKEAFGDKLAPSTLFCRGPLLRAFESATA